ncbi:MAG: class A beta-lactamase-related serine hydrolase [Bacteroidales bacterium]|nr:class A beta-lactamase-related serine hydrolase [Bacteroidales bacterium]
MRMKKLILCVVTAICAAGIDAAAARGQVSEAALAGLASGHQGDVGIAVIFRDKVYTSGNDARYPMMGLFSVHVAVATLDKLEEHGLTPDSPVSIKAGSLQSNSPLRKKYKGKTIETTYGEIIKYAVAHGDSSADDWLIDFVGGVGEVGLRVSSFDLSDFWAMRTSREMRQDIMNCYNNWSTPLSVAELLVKIYNGEILSAENAEFLQGVLLESRLGEDKLRAGLPDDVGLAHVAGRSDRIFTGDDSNVENRHINNSVKVGDSDAGVILLPNGERCYIVVMLKDSRESDEDDAKLMADVANMVFRQIYILR